MKHLLIFSILFFTVKFAVAQDPHFSQFFASPLTLNPAFTGKFNGIYRINGNHRNQWPSINNAFITNSVSIDFHLLESKLKQNNTFGLGFSFIGDNSANSAVKLNYGSLSLAYHKGLDEDGNNQLGIGLQVTYSNMFINTTNLKFEDQLTNRGFTQPTGETFANSNLQSHYFDLNAGVLFTGSTNENNNYYAGVSVYHVNKPKQSFTGLDYSLNARFTAHAGYFYQFNENLGLHLSGLQSLQGGSTETVVGGAMEFIVNPDATKPISVYAGSWLRISDAVIPYLGIEFNNTRLGITYDVNTSELKTASLGQGGLEVSLTYSHQPNTDRPVKCPKF